MSQKIVPPRKMIRHILRSNRGRERKVASDDSLSHCHYVRDHVPVFGSKISADSSSKPPATNTRPSLRVVKAILDARGTGRLRRTVSAAEVVEKAIRMPQGRKPRIHPATKTFQGIRIAINGELEAIVVALPKAFRALKQGGSLVVIAFHSLEDRIVKRFMRRMAGRPEHRRDSNTRARS